MANILRIWGKKANTKEQMETVGQELADEQLEAVIGGCGGCGQSSNQGSYQLQSYGDHHHRHRHGNDSSCQNQWQPNSGQNQWQPNSGC